MTSSCEERDVGNATWPCRCANGNGGGGRVVKSPEPKECTNANGRQKESKRAKKGGEWAQRSHEAVIRTSTASGEKGEEERRRMEGFTAASAETKRGLGSPSRTGSGRRATAKKDRDSFPPEARRRRRNFVSTRGRLKPVVFGAQTSRGLRGGHGGLALGRQRCSSRFRRQIRPAPDLAPAAGPGRVHQECPDVHIDAVLTILPPSRSPCVPTYRPPSSRDGGRSD